MKEERGTLWEWLYGSLFIVCCGWLCWHASAFILDWHVDIKKSQFAKISALHEKKDFTPNLPGLFGGFADIVDYAALVGIPVLLVLGFIAVRRSRMEFVHWRVVDRFAVFLGRVAMILIILMTAIMMYEVFMRYVIERPTSWANETTLWIGQFVFMFAGIYAMQQRTHIRITLFYDIMPRWGQRTVDIVWIAIFCLTTFLICYFSYLTVLEKRFLRWIVIDSDFQPPMPAVMHPVIWLVLILVSIQAILNLINDWNLTTEQMAGTDKAAEEAELEALKKIVRGED